MDRIEKSREIGRKIADAFVAGAMADENLFAPDATTWHNTDEIEIPHSASRAAWTIVRGLAPDFHAEDIRVHGFGDGFAIQYVFLGTLADGSRIRIPGCIIGTIRDGKIARMQEYVDSAHATKLAAAIQEAPTK